MRKVTALAENIQNLKLEDVLGDRFGRYSKYVIQDRAIPDVRDGLKPVQRRILYAMFREGNTFDKNYRKSAKAVGNVIGNYHPHGESSIYDAMVRLGQGWKMREELIMIHGNIGSMDGDPPAAMRYTEAKLAEISNEMVRDINKNTVDFMNNFDDTDVEPTVMPSRFPNILVNGSTGISAGYATDIPPHNLDEVIDATLKVIDKPTVKIDELLQIVKGPDFPTGGIIQGKDELKKAYETGRGRIIVRSKVETEELRGGKKLIAVTELPYEVNKANLVKKIDEIRADRKVDGILEVRDETDRQGLRIAIEVRKDANIEGIINYLYKRTDLQVAYNFNMVAISNRAPKLLGLKEVLTSYIDHQKEIIYKRSQFELEQAKKRMHIIEGLMKALSILDDVIRLIRESENKRNAKENLIEAFHFTEAQAEAIVMLQLYRLTNTDIVELETEHNELDYTINQLNEIINDEKKLLSVIKKELRDIKKKYSSERLTEVEDKIENIELDKKLLIPQEETILSLTRDGYVKRTSPRSFNASEPDEIGMKEDDFLVYLNESDTLQQLLVFTNLGNYLIIPVHEIPDIRWKDHGVHLSSRFKIEAYEMPVFAMTVDDYKDSLSIVSVTKNGQIKRSELSLFEAVRIKRPIVYMNLKTDDEVVDVDTSITGTEEILFVTEKGLTLKYGLVAVNSTGLRSQGVRAMNVKKDDEIIFAGIIKDERYLLTVSNRGAVKRTDLASFERGARAQVGTMLLKEIKSKPHRLVGAKLFDDNINAVIVSDSNNSTISGKDIRVTGKYVNGSFVVDEDAFGEVTDVYFDDINL